MRPFCIQIALLVVLAASSFPQNGGAKLALPSSQLSGSQRMLVLDGFFYRDIQRPCRPADGAYGTGTVERRRVVDRENAGRTDRYAFSARSGNDFNIRLAAEPSDGILKWGMAVDAEQSEYFTGLMERVVDGPQQASWAPGITRAMNLRGQKVDMIVKPTTSIYAPFYLSSRGYGVFVKGDWPGFFRFCGKRRRDA